MSMFSVHTVESAPPKAKPALAASQKTFGFVPNLHAVFAESPALLEGYKKLSQIFATSSLSPVEQQVVLLAASYENNCHYCMAAHSAAANMAGLPAEELDTLRNGAPMPDTRLEALRRFTQRIVQARGWVEENDVDAFVQAGYNKQQVLEVILGVAIKTMSNYTNHLAHTPLDDAFGAYAWQKPGAADSAPEPASSAHAG
ncbi:MAG: carboxymuconolactone decarboxylase family protein [Acidiferrobacterales bacterium]